MKTQSTKIWTLFSCAIIAVCLFFAASAFSNDNNNLILENTEALSDGETIIPVEDLIKWCDNYCFEAPGYVCVLVTTYGFNVNCDEMDAWQ